jgi:hypothetical protein
MRGGPVQITMAQPPFSCRREVPLVTRAALDNRTTAVKHIDKAERSLSKAFHLMLNGGVSPRLLTKTF